eukprot:Rhum_TRINITY_DN14494_c28_g1::Rhum_TRINITY_DN14494_c28_g1_i1::g.93042::m.93042
MENTHTASGVKSMPGRPNSELADCESQTLILALLAVPSLVQCCNASLHRARGRRGLVVVRLKAPLVAGRLRFLRLRLRLFRLLRLLRLRLRLRLRRRCGDRRRRKELVAGHALRKHLADLVLQIRQLAPQLLLLGNHRLKLRLRLRLRGSFAIHRRVLRHRLRLNIIQLLCRHGLLRLHRRLLRHRHRSLLSLSLRRLRLRGTGCRHLLPGHGHLRCSGLVLLDRPSRQFFVRRRRRRHLLFSLLLGRLHLHLCLCLCLPVPLCVLLRHRRQRICVRALDVSCDVALDIGRRRRVAGRGRRGGGVPGAHVVVAAVRVVLVRGGVGLRGCGLVRCFGGVDDGLVRVEVHGLLPDRLARVGVCVVVHVVLVFVEPDPVAVDAGRRVVVVLRGGSSFFGSPRVFVRRRAASVTRVVAALQRRSLVRHRLLLHTRGRTSDLRRSFGARIRLLCRRGRSLLHRRRGLQRHGGHVRLRVVVVGLRRFVALRLLLRTIGVRGDDGRRRGVGVSRLHRRLKLRRLHLLRHPLLHRVRLRRSLLLRVVVLRHLTRLRR